MPCHSTCLQWLRLAVRTIYVLFCVLTSLYCLLAYVPFTWEQMLKSNMVPQAGMFARWHPEVQAIMTLLLFWDLWPDLRAALFRGAAKQRWNWIPLILAGVQTAFTAVCLISPVLVTLASEARSYVFGVLALVPALIFTAYRCVSTLATKEIGSATIPEAPPTRLFVASGLAAVLVSALYALMGALEHPEAFSWTTTFAAVVMHVVLFGGFCLAIDAVVCLGRAAGLTSRWVFCALHVLFLAGVWRCIFVQVCRPFGFDGELAVAYSGLLALTLIHLYALHALHHSVRLDTPRAIGLEAVLTPCHFGLVRGPGRSLVMMALVSAAAMPAAIQISRYDWNHMFQNLTAFAVWLTLFSCCFMLAAGLERRKIHRAYCLLVLFGVLGVLKLGQATTAPVFAGMSGAIHQSGKLAATMLAPRADTGDDLFRFLTANTNLPHSMHVDPINVEFSTNLTATPGWKPHIFVITVDSLRRDYLSPYNSAVQFTPAIDEFAKESFVFRKAFTRYGGTGLSEPSIWSGSLLLHKQYVTPFAPMNALEKLLRAEKYKTHISRDTILTTLLSPPLAGSDDDLDTTTQNMDYDLARSLEELQMKLDRRGSDDRPVFAYTQPQNLHISVLQRERASAAAGESWARFHAPYATRVRSVDAAFGRFIQYLKRSGLYEHSIVVLTSDHGDSLGEDGRWGHAYTIYPEIVQIPLLIHLPERLKASWQADTNAVAFSSDLTPSLYALLGHSPSVSRSEYGRSLFEPEGRPVKREKVEQYLLASSYGAVYGALSSDGARLYIVDAVNYAEYLYDLSGPAPESASPTFGEAERAREFIRQSVASIGAMYGVAAHR